MDAESLEQLLASGWIAAPGATLRDEERKKARELEGVLAEIARACGRIARSRRELVLVDAAAGKGYVGVLAARRDARVRAWLVERDEGRAAAAREAAARLDVRAHAVAGDVGDPAAWPERADVVVALHACGDASDRAIARGIAADARWILIAPCCVAASLPAARRADARADALGVPRGELRRGLIETLVTAERVLALESHGWRTEVVAFAAPSVTPHRHLLRAERVREPARMEDARRRLERLQNGGTH